MGKGIVAGEVLVGCISTTMALVMLMASRQAGIRKAYRVSMLVGFTSCALAAWLLASLHIGGLPHLLRLVVLITAVVFGVVAVIFLLMGIVSKQVE